MESSGTAEKIRTEDGNLRYQYFQALNDPETVLLIDRWRERNAIDEHHASPMMKTITALHDDYDLHMKVERFISTGGRCQVRLAEWVEILANGIILGDRNMRISSYRKEYIKVEEQYRSNNCDIPASIKADYRAKEWKKTCS